MFLISVDSARPDGDEHLHLVDLRLADLLDERVGERLAGLGDHFAVRVDDVDGERAAHRALTALDRVLLVAQVDRHVRREDLDRVDVLAAEAVVHLFGQLVAFLDEQHVLGALALGLAPSWCAPWARPRPSLRRAARCLRR